MWIISRPDAVNVWKNAEVRTRYPRYRKILDGEKVTRYLIAKKIPIKGMSKAITLEKLWLKHDEAVAAFNKLLTQLDNNELSLKELDSPEFSFLDLKEKIAYEILKHCHFCERKCKVNRTKNELGFCRVGKDSIVSSAFLHSGEESILVPSGTIFFAGCTFTCVFCQNYDISQEWQSNIDEINPSGVKVTPKKIALLAHELYADGAKNINLVGGDPTPNVHSILSFLNHFSDNITILWNSNMYQSFTTSKLLLEVIDFWLPDFKYWENSFARQMSGVENYREVVSRNIKLAYEQGSKEILVRHLIMPTRIEKDTFPILQWCAKEIPLTMVNIMDQYHPDYLIQRRSFEFNAFNRRISSKEWEQVTKKADELGIFWKPVS